MPKRVRADEDKNGSIFVVKINSQKEPRELYFRIKQNIKMGNLFASYFDRHGTNYQSVQFLFKGQRIRRSSTPIDLGLRDGDEIDAMEHVDGGSGSGRGY